MGLAEMRKLILLLIVLLSGCSTAEVRLGALYDFNKDIEGDNPMAILDIQFPVSEKTTCGYTHISHFTSGFPFNDRPEQNANTLGCYWRIK